MKATVIRFGLIAVALLALFQLSKYTLLFSQIEAELWIAAFALLFISMGIVLGRHILRPTLRAPLDKLEIDHEKVDTLGITAREYEVLEQIAKGLSNREIAAELFLSESTVKTHVSNLFVKLDSKRRTEAVRRAQELKII